MYCIVSPFSKTFDDIWLTYFVPEFLRSDLKVWQIVEIPLKNSVEDAIVLSILNQNEVNIERSKIKSIINIKFLEPLLKDYQIELAKYLAEFYFAHIHDGVNLFLPKTIRTKIKNNKLNLWIFKDNKYNFSQKKEFNKEQEEVYNQIINETKNKILLYWVTWSGKTEIYIKLIKKYLDEWKQVLFLIPEIILTNQIGERIKKVFWEEVIIINSNITESKKSEYWLKIKGNKAKMVVWTRSSIFYPFVDLGLIIMDEEHDNSYISDKSPRYNSIEVIEKISDLLNIKIVLWSWTPSVDMMYKWVKWEYKIFNLLSKFV